jgi:hypothetical protein
MLFKILYEPDNIRGKIILLLKQDHGSVWKNKTAYVLAIYVKRKSLTPTSAAAYDRWTFRATFYFVILNFYRKAALALVRPDRKNGRGKTAKPMDNLTDRKHDYT